MGSEVGASQVGRKEQSALLDASKAKESTAPRLLHLLLRSLTLRTGPESRLRQRW